MSNLTSSIHVGISVALMSFLGVVDGVAQEGGDWQLVHSGSWPFVSMAVSKPRPQLILAGNGFDVYRSEDGGETWARSSGVLFVGDGIACDPEDAEVAYAGRSHGMAKTINGGRNWFELDDLNAGPGARSLAIDPSNTRRIFAGVEIGWGLYRSMNSGATWQRVLSSQDVQAVEISAADPNVVLAGTGDYSNYPQGIFKSTDGGDSWNQILEKCAVLSLATDPGDTDRLYAGTKHDGVLRSQDGGETWQRTGSELDLLPVSALFVHPRNRTHLLAATKGAGVFLSRNSGDTWQEFNEGLVDRNCLCMALDPTTGRSLFVGTQSGRIFRSRVPEFGTGPDPRPRFVRGDCNGDGTVEGISDAVTILLFGFGDFTEMPCLAACDSDGRGGVNAIVDAIWLLRYFFLQGPPPPTPFPQCGTSSNSSTGQVDCASPTEGC